MAAVEVPQGVSGEAWNSSDRLSGLLDLSWPGFAGEAGVLNQPTYCDGSGPVAYPYVQ